jgi:hypothetical protein
MRTIWVITGLLLTFAAPLEAWAADPGGLLPAVWKEQRFDFVYMGQTSRYSCDGLRDKMRSLLLIVGARRDLKVAAVGCAESARIGLAIGPRVAVTFSSPVPPDPAAKPLRKGDLEPVDASYQPFTLTSDAFRNFGIGDCELVEEFNRQILPKFATRNVKPDITCVPNQLVGSRFFVSGEALMMATHP